LQQGCGLLVCLRREVIHSSSCCCFPLIPPPPISYSNAQDSSRPIPGVYFHCPWGHRVGLQVAGCGRGYLFPMASLQVFEKLTICHRSHYFYLYRRLRLEAQSWLRPVSPDPADANDSPRWGSLFFRHGGVPHRDGILCFLRKGNYVRLLLVGRWILTTPVSRKPSVRSFAPAATTVYVVRHSD